VASITVTDFLCLYANFSFQIEKIILCISDYNVLPPAWNNSDGIKAARRCIRV